MELKNITHIFKEGNNWQTSKFYLFFFTFFLTQSMYYNITARLICMISSVIPLLSKNKKEVPRGRGVPNLSSLQESTFPVTIIVLEQVILEKIY